MAGGASFPGHSVLLALAFASLLVLPTSHAQNGGPRPFGCLRAAYSCNLLPQQCGVYHYCGNKKKIVACAACGKPATPTAGPTEVCNFNYGRCVPNTAAGPGAPCAVSKSRCRGAGAGYFCFPDASPTATRSQTGFRCCRKACPEGAWGGSGFFWRNECNEVIRCQGTP